MIFYNGALYAGTQASSGGCQVRRYDEASATWTQVNESGFGAGPDEQHNSVMAGPKVVPIPTLEGPGASRVGDVTLTGHVDTTGISDPVTVRVFEGSNVKTIATVNGYGNYSAHVGGLSYTTHTFYAKAYMGPSVSEESEPLQVMVSLTAPLVVDALVVANGQPVLYSWEKTIRASGLGVSPPPPPAPAWYGSEIPVQEMQLQEQIRLNTKMMDSISLIVRTQQEIEHALVRNAIIPEPGDEYTWRGYEYTSPLRLARYKAREALLQEIELTFKGLRIPDSIKLPDIPERINIDSNLEYDLVSGPDDSGEGRSEASGKKVAGARVTIERKGSNGKFSSWPAGEFDQPNPAYTDALGWYAWDVPDGQYRVVVEKSSYTKDTSRVVTVRPDVGDLDIGIERSGPCSYFFAEGTTRAGFE